MMNKKFQKNLIKSLNDDKEIYNLFIAELDNMIDRIIENKIPAAEKNLENLLNKIGDEVSVKGKIRLVNFLNKKAKQYKKLKNTNWALLLYNNVLTINIELVKLKPHNANFRKYLSDSYNNVGNIYMAMGNNKKALVFFEKNLNILEFLITKDPKSTYLKRELSYRYSRMVYIYETMGNTKKALEYFKKDLKILEDLVNLKPERINYRINYITSLLRLYLSYAKEKKLIWIIKAKKNLILLTKNGVKDQTLNLLLSVVNSILSKNNYNI